MTSRSKTIFILSILLLAITLAACAQATVETTPLSTAMPTSTLAEPEVQTTRAPDPQSAVQAYLDAWVGEQYAAMYAMLTPISQDAITAEEFEKFYRDFAAEAALSGWQYELLSSLVNPRSAQVGYRVTLHSVLVGDLVRETQMNLSLEGGEWLEIGDTGAAYGNYVRIISLTVSNVYDLSESALWRRRI
jgi:hypothetical protein